MTKAELLIKIREDRPGQVIHEVISFEKNKFGHYDVVVDMEGQFFNTTIRHIKQRLPYPLEEFNKLSKVEQLEWQWGTLRT